MPQAKPTWYWAATLLAALPVSISIAIVIAEFLGRRRWRRRAMATPRDLFETITLVSDLPLFEDTTSEQAAHGMASPRRRMTDTLDIDRTVDATARAAGLVTPVFRELPAGSHYVMVVEEAGRHDHLARIGDLLVDRLLALGVIGERFHMVLPGLVRDATEPRTRCRKWPTAIPTAGCWCWDPGRP